MRIPDVNLLQHHLKVDVVGGYHKNMFSQRKVMRLISDSDGSDGGFTIVHLSHSTHSVSLKKVAYGEAARSQPFFRSDPMSLDFSYTRSSIIIFAIIFFILQINSFFC